MENLKKTEQKNTVYGPVDSWRFGPSLGIDLLPDQSTCSFRCHYCQLGKIEDPSTARRTFVATELVLKDLQECVGKDGEYVMTFSGCGEPTLAKNFGEVSRALKAEAHDKEQILLTNGLLLKELFEGGELEFIDRVIVKLDAINDRIWQKMNHPVGESELEKVIDDIKYVRAHGHFKVDVQTMVTSLNQDSDWEQFSVVLNDIFPDKIYLNTPSRPYPQDWEVGHRGNHSGHYNVHTTKIKKVEILPIAARLIHQSPQLTEKIVVCPL